MAAICRHVLFLSQHLARDCCFSKHTQSPPAVDFVTSSENFSKTSISQKMLVLETKQIFLRMVSQNNSHALFLSFFNPP